MRTALRIVGFWMSWLCSFGAHHPRIYTRPRSLLPFLVYRASSVLNRRSASFVRLWVSQHDNDGPGFATHLLGRYYNSEKPNSQAQIPSTLIPHPLFPQQIRPHPQMDTCAEPTNILCIVLPSPSLQTTENSTGASTPPRKKYPNSTTVHHAIRRRRRLPHSLPTRLIVVRRVQDSQDSLKMSKVSIILCEGGERVAYARNRLMMSRYSEIAAMTSSSTCDLRRIICVSTIYRTSQHTPPAPPRNPKQLTM